MNFGPRFAVLGIMAALAMLVPLFSASAQTANAAAIEQEIQTLQAQLQALENTDTGTAVVGIISNPGGIGTGFRVASGPVIIDQNGGIFPAGWDIFFTGRGFAPYEPILIFQNGVSISQAQANASGNFQARGIPLPFGVSTYAFVGQVSGRSGTAAVRGVGNILNQF